MNSLNLGLDGSNGDLKISQKDFHSNGATTLVFLPDGNKQYGGR